MAGHGYMAGADARVNPQREDGVSRVGPANEVLPRGPEMPPTLFRSQIPGGGAEGDGGSGPSRSD